MDFMQKGYVSLDYNDEVARSSYLNEIPMIAECLPFSEFKNELEKVAKSIARSPNLVLQFNQIIPQIIQYLDRDQTYQIIYQTGEFFSNGSNDKIKQEFLNLTEKILQDANDIPYEFENYVKPKLITGQGGFSISRFALWRIARLTVLCDDKTPFESVIFTLFAGDDITVSSISSVLYLMDKSIAKKYLIKALTNSKESARIGAINAIETFEFDTREAFIDTVFKNETENMVLLRIVQLPPKLLSEEVIKILMTKNCTSSFACSIALQSPYLLDFIPMLKERNVEGCELNNLDFSVIMTCDPIPFDFLSLLLRQSKEILHNDTIESILRLDKTQIMPHLIFPRINEKGNWRSRYNAILITSKMLENSSHGVDPLDPMDQQDLAGFIVAMGLDLVYSVRKAAFNTLKFFSDSSAASIIESLISIVNQTDEFQKQILREFFELARSSIIKYEDREKLKNTMTMLGINDASYFDVSK